MGQKLNIYFKDEVLEQIQAEDNKSGLINDLLLQYYDDTEDNMQRKYEKLERQSAIVKQHLLEKKKERVALVRAKEEEISIKKKTEERKELIEKFNNLRNGDKISDDDYWDCYDEEAKQFDLEKVKVIINKLEEQQ